MKTIKRLFQFPFQLIAVLERIDGRLRKLEETSAKLDQCINDGRNHQGRHCLRTGHWNDTERH